MEYLESITILSMPWSDTPPEKASEMACRSMNNRNAIG